ncbi:MAG: hypothetical protein ABJK37_16330 [Paraglaciecola sp.]|uniref:hypothetical protein n=1 Tax=Paraglaciecola sp. TaxID=1920173 RepID=UPI003297EAA3
MHFLQNNNWPVSTVLRSLLSIAFLLWLGSVMFQYDENRIENDKQVNDKQPLSNIVIEQLTLPPVPKASVKTQTKPRPFEQSPAPLIKEVTQSPSVTQQQVQQVYEQLSDQGVDIQIAWPQNMSHQQQALNFMYQCADMQFAVLNGNNITKVNQPKPIDYSDWIRVAQGNLSKKEQHWLTAYALSGTPIRLFPREIDYRLAQHLAATLKGAPLITLRADYQVANQRLLLNNIQLNNQPIKSSWRLYQGQCD